MSVGIEAISITSGDICTSNFDQLLKHIFFFFFTSHRYSNYHNFLAEALLISQNLVCKHVSNSLADSNDIFFYMYWMSGC